MNQLLVERIRREFPTRAEPLPVLKDASLSLSAGENLAIVGPSGSGKSTLLHIIGTLDRPTSGSVRLCDTNPYSLDEPRLARFRNRHIGFIFQDHYLLPQLNVWENVMVPAVAERTANTDDANRARQLLERVGLQHRLQHLPSELSGGERQRVAVARALFPRPALILADEPTGNLDRKNAEEIGQLLLELQSEPAPQSMLVVVTHSESLAGLMQRQRILQDGVLLD
ncbi:MAG: ABC transporter ATP-binding protein [Pirellulaceae bacterium]|nr:ABC transporter ATP-binding protein [Planctomycetales bacterium]